jgi:catechol 2,3-dioxygenase-like lactoylglutathione lyase family enzyme
MLGHLGLNVADLASAKAYYDIVMPSLGYTEFFSTDDEFAYMPADGKRGTYLFFYPAAESSPYSRDVAGLQHLAFIRPTRQAVIDAYDVAIGLGSTEVHPPQEWPQYPPPYFAAFWLDPHGFMIEAVCHHDRDH